MQSFGKEGFTRPVYPLGDWVGTNGSPVEEYVYAVPKTRGWMTTMIRKEGTPVLSRTTGTSLSLALAAMVKTKKFEGQ